ncbi:hypothetical protein [Burkholderia ubonensis]|uniref:hypothetical protein n=1 Tax=Burkholderia ubonensis TaxID=101571 RepID=UPI0009B40277|nr:hypothetical protein [Burkholderia ubonensis]
MDGARGGTHPPSLDHDELSLLEDFARMPGREIAALHLATTDDLTQLITRRGFDTLARHVHARLAGTAQPPQPGALAIASRICSGVRSR